MNPILGREQTYLDIVALDGSLCRLSEKLYVIADGYKSQIHDDPDYAPGKLVRMVCHHYEAEPGQHFNAEYATVCRFAAITAEFLGVPREYLVEVPADLLAIAVEAETTTILSARLAHQPEIRPLEWRRPGPLALLVKSGGVKLRTHDGRRVHFDNNNHAVIE